MQEYVAVGENVAIVLAGILLALLALLAGIILFLARKDANVPCPRCGRTHYAEKTRRKGVLLCDDPRHGPILYLVTGEEVAKEEGGSP
ncbi:MAG TPA: hypothetical protein VJL32_01235 [Candidatus Paceibacterota bacterium]